MCQPYPPLTCLADFAPTRAPSPGRSRRRSTAGTACRWIEKPLFEPGRLRYSAKLRTILSDFGQSQRPGVAVRAQRLELHDDLPRRAVGLVRDDHFHPAVRGLGLGDHVAELDARVDVRQRLAVDRVDDHARLESAGLLGRRAGLDRLDPDNEVRLEQVETHSHRAELGQVVDRQVRVRTLREQRIGVLVVRIGQRGAGQTDQGGEDGAMHGVAPTVLSGGVEDRTARTLRTLITAHFWAFPRGITSPCARRRTRRPGRGMSQPALLGRALAVLFEQRPRFGDTAAEVLGSQRPQ
jgi:hypothetical protein